MKFLSFVVTRIVIRATLVCMRVTLIQLKTLNNVICSLINPPADLQFLAQVEKPPQLYHV